MSIKTPLRVLIVEDSEFDARVIVNVLRAGGYEPAHQRVDTGAAMRTAMTEQSWDVILADYNLPEFSAPEALKAAQQSGLDLPFIIISGGIGEDIAVQAMKAGAHDYLMKGNLARLVPAVERELREAANRAARREAEAAMRESELRYRLLWETCPDAVILMDAQNRIHFVNPAIHDVFGYRPEEVIGQDLSLLQPENLRDGHRLGVQHFLQTGGRTENWRATETLGRRKDGVEINLEVSFSDLMLHGERRFVGFVRDITERKRTERELRKNEEQFATAREIQQSLFPKSAPVLPGFEIAGASYPAEAAGGDYFDYLPMKNGQLGLVVGDVTGHGLGPALFMAETRAYFHILVRNREDLAEIFTRANQVLAEDIGSERFVTLMLAQIDAPTRTLTYANAGHPAGYVLGAGGEIKAKLRRTGVPLGLHPLAEFKVGEKVELASGDVVLLLTDGIEEATSLTEQFFGADRAVEFVRAHLHLPARAIVEQLHRAVRDFEQNGVQGDDITMVVVKVL